MAIWDSGTCADHDAELGFHGDAELRPGLVDLAVNVRDEPMPRWLAEPIERSTRDLAAYPDPAPACSAVATRHGRGEDEVLVTAGSAAAFVLVAQAFRELGHPVVIHPQFTGVEAALLDAGHRVHRLLLPAETGFVLDPAAVPAQADLVAIGNPTNPTSVCHPASNVAGLARPGRILLVDEAFADTVAGEPDSLAARTDLPGLVVVRSLSKTWGLAGLRAGYVLAEPRIVARLRRAAPLWSVSSPALAAIAACATPAAMLAEQAIAHQLAAHRAHLIAGLREIAPVRLAGTASSSFVLIHVPDGAQVRRRLAQHGYAVRRGETFPGLGSNWLRLAVREPPIIDAFLRALSAILDRE
jgi:histidinol-phosphate aminotransferase